MKSIGVTQFKQQCLSLLDQLEPEGLIVTKRGAFMVWAFPITRACQSGTASGLVSGLYHSTAAC